MLIEEKCSRRGEWPAVSEEDENRVLILRYD